MLKKVIGILAVFVVFAAFVPTLNAQVHLLQEDFESSFPPSGWTLTNGGNGDSWTREDHHSGGYWDPTVNWTNGSGHCALDDDDYWWNYPNPSSLVSPTVDATDLSNVHLDFEFYGYDPYFGSSDHCEVEFNVGEGWAMIADEATSGAFSRSYNISTMADDNPNVQIRFSYYSSSWMYGCQVDDVDIWGEEGGGPGPGEGIDPEMVQISRPKPEEEAGIAFDPACRILNTEDSVVHVQVMMRIKNINTQSIVYEDILHEYLLDPGYTEITAFKSFTPDGNTNYEALAVLEHPDDRDTDNNNASKLFSTATGQEVTPVLMIAPETPDQYNAFMPKASYVERAGAESTPASLICTIEDNTYHAIIYADTAAQIFSAADSIDIEFAEAAGLTDGSYTITFWAEDEKNTTTISDPILVEDFNYTGIVEEPVAERFSLTASGGNVRFTLPSATSVNLRVYDIAGNMVADLASGTYSAGTYEASFDANPGVYFVKLVSPKFTRTEKVTVLK